MRYGGSPIMSSRAITASLPARTVPIMRCWKPSLPGRPSLVARWLLIGFIHGVMNTDNTSISGETIDYGPCAFMDHYDPAQVFSSIDEMGRYAYANQPRIALWNLTRLAECLLPLFADDQEKAIAEAQDILGAFPEAFSKAYHAGLRRKVGLFTMRDGDEALIQDLLDAMAKNQADFTLTFRKLGDAAAEKAGDADVRAQFMDPTAFDDWATRWRERTGESRRLRPSGGPPCTPSTPCSSRATIASRPSSRPR